MIKDPFKILVMFLMPLILKIKNKNTLSIMIYHRVLKHKDHMRPDTPTINDFDWQMEIIAKYFTPLSLSDGLKKMEEGCLPKNAICVTFDDGYSDNESLALPILKKWNIQATIFISTGVINGGIMWNDIVIEAIRSEKNEFLDLRLYGMELYDLSTENKKCLAANAILQKIKHFDSGLRAEIVEYIMRISSAKLSSDLMLTSEQIENLVNSDIEIGAHTVSHPILSKLSKAKAYNEIYDGKKILESITGKKCKFFAYPNGRPGIDYLPEHVEMLKDIPFEAGFSTNWGVSNNKSNRFEMARFTPWDKKPMRFMVRLILNMRKII